MGPFQAPFWGQIPLYAPMFKGFTIAIWASQEGPGTPILGPWAQGPRGRIPVPASRNLLRNRPILGVGWLGQPLDQLGQPLAGLAGV